MAAVHKKFLNRLKEENSSCESAESDVQTSVYKSTDEEVDSKGCTESETDSTNREKTESPVSEESTTSYEAKDSSSSDETGDSSSEKLTIVTSSSLEEEVYVKREVTSPSGENEPGLSTEEQPPQSDETTTSPTRNMVADTTIKSESFSDQLSNAAPLTQGSISGSLNSSLLVHPAPTYSSSTSRSEAIARTHALSSSSSSSVVNAESPRKKIIYQHQSNISYSSNETYSTPSAVDSTVSNSYSVSSGERQMGSEILRSAITGNTKLLENKSSTPGVKFIITQNRKSRPETKYGASSPHASSTGQYHKYNESSSHTTNYGSPNRSLPAQVIYRTTQNVNHAQESTGSSPSHRFTSPSPSRASYNPHHSEQGGSYSQTSSPIRSSSRPGMPSGYRYSPQNASAAKPTYQNMQMPGRSGVPPRRVSEGSHQTVLVRCPKKIDSGFHSSFMSGINGGSPLGGVTPQGVMMPPSLLSTVHATSSTHPTMSSPSNPSPPATTSTSAPPLTTSGGSELDTSPHFCLKWNNHEKNLMGTLESVMATEQYADVTIYCEGSIIKVHKLVLLASSSHFEKLLRHTPDHQHPFIVMDGTKLSDIQCLVEYMYKGKVNIAQDNITSLLKTAERLQIKGLVNIETEGSQKTLRETSAGRVREPSHPRPSSASSAPQMQSSMSPPPKRSRISPVDNILRDSAWKDRSESDPRMEPRDLSRDSNRDWMKDLSAERLGDYRSGSRDREVEGVKREIDPTSRNSNPYQTSSNGPTSNGQRRHTPSPVTSSPSARNSVGPSSYYSRASQYDQLLPPRSSPKSPDNKLTNNLGIPSFGIPFGLSNLPMMQDSKKLLGGNPSMLLQGSRYDGEERAPSREHDRYPASWPPRHNGFDRSERDLENRGDRSREVGEQKLNILHKALLQHKPGQPMDIDRHHSLPHMLNYPLPQKHPFGSMPAPNTHGSTVSFPQASPHYSGGSFTAEAHFDVKNLKTLKDLADSDRSHEDDKSSMSPPHDKSQYSPPSDDSGGSTKHESDSLVMDEEEENSRSSTVGSNGSLSTDIRNTKVYKKTVKTGTEDKVKCPYCSKAYRHQNNLRTHIRCFHKGVRIPCPICKRGFTRWFTVRCHIAREHAGEPIPNMDKIPANMRKQLTNHPPYADQGQMPSLGPYPDELRLGSSNAGFLRYGEPHHSNGALPSQP